MHTHSQTSVTDTISSASSSRANNIQLLNYVTEVYTSILLSFKYYLMFSWAGYAYSR